MPGADILHFPNTIDATGFLLDSSNDIELCADDLKISNRMHESLDLGDVLGTFLRALRQEFPVSGLRHTLPDGKEQITLGRTGRSGRPDCEFIIKHAGENLGTLLLGNLRTPDPRILVLLRLLRIPLFNALTHHRLKQLARKDSLTGLGNRLAMETALANETARAQRFGQPFTLLIIDIDHFKHVNDTYGHSAGDEVIRRLSGEIRQSLRPYDQGFRYGGEEFVVLLSQTTLAKGLQIAERIRFAAQARRLCEAGGESVTVSIGAAEFRCEEESLHELFERADSALYKAKREGRNQVRTT